MSDGTFKRIEQEEGERFGTPAVLLCGYSQAEADAIVGLMERIDCGDHRVLLCTEKMLEQTLGHALETIEQTEPVAQDKLPRAMVLSGFSGAQIHKLIDNYAYAGIRRPIFAAVTPNNLNFTVKELLVDLLKEHRAMTQKQK